MVIPIETSGLTTALVALEVKPEVIDKIVGILNGASDDLGDGQFATGADVPIRQFGQRPSAHQLGVHHQKAHEVMQTTIDGIAADLMAFAAGAKTAITYINDADGNSAVDLAQAQQAVEDLTDINRNSQGDQNYDQGRNNPGSVPTPGQEG